jgi:hypothetical protein
MHCDWAQWNPNMTDARTEAQIVKDIARLLAEYSLRGSVYKTFHRFVDEMREPVESDAP